MSEYKDPEYNLYPGCDEFWKHFDIVYAIFKSSIIRFDIYILDSYLFWNHNTNLTSKDSFLSCTFSFILKYVNLLTVLQASIHKNVYNCVNFNDTIIEIYVLQDWHC